MRRPFLVRMLALAGAAFALFAAGSAASVTLLGDRVVIDTNPGENVSGPALPQAVSSDQQVQHSQLATHAGQTAGGNSAQAGDPAMVQPAGPTIFEQQARAQQPGQPSQQISVGPTIFEQQVRSQAPKPKPVPGPGPFTRGPGPGLH